MLRCSTCTTTLKASRLLKPGELLNVGEVPKAGEMLKVGEILKVVVLFKAGRLVLDAIDTPQSYGLVGEQRGHLPPQHD